MTELKPTWSKLLRIGWLIFWRGAAGGSVLGFISGFATGLVYSLLGYTTTPLVAASISGFIVSVPWWFLVLRMALRKTYSDFRIALLPPVVDESVQQTT